MGSQAVQGQLWGTQPADWAAIQEQTGKAGYDHALHFLQLTTGKKLLDVGCGSGIFLKMVKEQGTTTVTGIDASAALIEEAKKRNPAIELIVGEMEELPFDDQTFDVVSGFNSFQYAATVKNALAEAKRVLKDDGKLVVMIWGNKEDCEAASYLKAVGGQLPPPPPGAPGPFALSENKLLENVLEETGFTVIDNTDIATVWEYPDTATALKGLMSAGPVARAVEHSGFDKVQAAIADAMEPYIQADGKVVYHNKFRVVIAKK